jgi:MraZ protein
MFRGSSYHTVDEKGRFAIPARFRDVLRASGFDGIMVSRLDGCLMAYTLEEWGKIESRILNLAERSESMRRFRRVFIGEAASCPCDKQGRVLIPPTLRQYGELDRDIVMVGVLDHFEVWARKKWDQESIGLDDDMRQEEVRNQIAKLGL